MYKLTALDEWKLILEYVEITNGGIIFSEKRNKKSVE